MIWKYFEWYVFILCTSGNVSTDIKHSCSTIPYLLPVDSSLMTKSISHFKDVLLVASTAPYDINKIFYMT